MKLNELQFSLLSEHIDKAQLTEQLLRSISTHLSNKKECRGKVYRVAIGVKDIEQAICKNWSFSYDSSIFFDIDTRIKAKHGRYGEPPIQHIIISHFHDELFAGVANGNQVQIYTGKLINGVYEYRKSTSGKYRRWFKVE